MLTWDETYGNDPVRDIITALVRSELPPERAKSIDEAWERRSTPHPEFYLFAVSMDGVRSLVGDVDSLGAASEAATDEEHWDASCRALLVERATQTEYWLIDGQWVTREDTLTLSGRMVEIELDDEDPLGDWHGRNE